jgi:hypothetical protein
MRFSKVLGTLALLYVILSVAVLNQEYYYNYTALSRRINPVIPKGGNPTVAEKEETRTVEIPTLESQPVQIHIMEILTLEKVLVYQIHKTVDILTH